MTDPARPPWTLSVDLELSEHSSGCVIRHAHAEIPVSNGDKFARLFTVLCELDEQPEVAGAEYTILDGLPKSLAGAPPAKEP